MKKFGYQLYFICYNIHIYEIFWIFAIAYNTFFSYFYFFLFFHIGDGDLNFGSNGFVKYIIFLTKKKYNFRRKKIYIIYRFSSLVGIIHVTILSFFFSGLDKKMMEKA